MSCGASAKDGTKNLNGGRAQESSAAVLQKLVAKYRLQALCNHQWPGSCGMRHSGLG
jgi:hypothetical protein